MMNFTDYNGVRDHEEVEDSDTQMEVETSDTELGKTMLTMPNTSVDFDQNRHQNHAPDPDAVNPWLSLNGFNKISVSGILPPARNGTAGGIIFEPVKIFCPVDPTYPLLSRACLSPPVYVVENFLPAEICERLMAETGPFLVRAPVVGVGNGEISAARTSTTCYLDRSQVPSIVSRVSRLLQNKPIEHIELPQVGRYMHGEEYKAHFDAFDLNSIDGRRFADNGGQRVCTVLIYLNDVPSGGQTIFPGLKLAFNPKQGRALVFFPATMDGVLDTNALHAAMPAVDTKFVCQVCTAATTVHSLP
jgi:prolyl 4-hydroxylase